MAAALSWAVSNAHGGLTFCTGGTPIFWGNPEQSRPLQVTDGSKFGIRQTANEGEQARLIHAALAHLNVDCPIVVGFSWGGGLSLIYALQYPGETCGLVLLTPRAFPNEATRSVAYQLGRTPVLGDLFRHTVMLPMARRMIRDRLGAGYAPDPPLREHIAAASDMWSRPGQAEAAVWDSRNLDVALQSYSTRYHEITSPVVIVVGDHDRPDRESIPLSKQIPGAELVLISRTGHLIPHVRPQAVIAAIDAVAARSPAVPGTEPLAQNPAEP